MNPTYYINADPSGVRVKLCHEKYCLYESHVHETLQDALNEIIDYYKERYERLATEAKEIEEILKSKWENGLK